MIFLIFQELEEFLELMSITIHNITTILSIVPPDLLAYGTSYASYNILNIAYKKNWTTGNLCKIFDVSFNRLYSVAIIAFFNEMSNFMGISYHIHYYSLDNIIMITDRLSFSGNTVTFDNSNIVYRRG